MPVEEWEAYEADVDEPDDPDGWRDICDDEVTR